MTRRTGYLSKSIEGKWYVIAFAAVMGITSSFYNVPLAAVVIFVMIVAGYALWKKKVIYGMSVLSFMLFFCWGVYVEKVNITSLSELDRGFTGEIVSLPEMDGDHFSFRFRLDQDETVQVSYYVKEKSELTSLRKLSYGMTCLFQGELKKPRTAGNFYGFDYRRYLHRQSIHWIFTPETVPLSSCHDNASPYDQLLQWRQFAVRFIQQTFPDEISGISAALLFGERNGVEQSVLTSYQSLGIIHILAVSGLHVGLVTGAFYFLLIRIGMTKERALEVLFITLPIYIIITGSAPSIVRAGLMGMAVLLSLRFRKRVHPLDGISIVCLAMLIHNPYNVLQAGFQLSFAVSFGLISSAPSIQRRYRHTLSQLAAVTIVAQLSALPLILYHFFEVSLLSLPMNLLFIPFISFVVLPSALIAFLFYLTIPFIGETIAAMLAWLVQYAHQFLLFVNHLPFGMLTFGRPTWFIMLPLILAIGYFFVQWEKEGGKRRCTRSVAILAIVLLFQWCAPYISDKGAVTVLDVGQGDSILIELPHRRAVYLIDAGGKLSFEKERWKERDREFNVGRDIVLQELKARGIRQIDRLILTHGDMDHIGGARALLKGIHIKEILYGKITSDTQKQLLNDAHNKEVRVRKVKRGVSWQAGRSSFAVVNPTGSEVKSNGTSVVIGAEIGGLKWLFTGDLEEEGERVFVRDYPNFDIDVLKVGHHGSQTSTAETFLNSVQPEVALVSAGENNMYGHPSREVMERLKKHRIPILRTDQHGAIRFRFDPGNITFEWVKRH